MPELTADAEVECAAIALARFLWNHEGDEADGEWTDQTWAEADDEGRDMVRDMAQEVLGALASAGHLRRPQDREEGRVQGRAERDAEVAGWVRELDRCNQASHALIDLRDEARDQRDEARAELATLRAAYAELVAAARAWRAQFSDPPRGGPRPRQWALIAALDALPAQTKEASDG